MPASPQAQPQARVAADAVETVADAAVAVAVATATVASAANPQGITQRQEPDGFSARLFVFFLSPLGGKGCPACSLYKLTKISTRL